MLWRDRRRQRDAAKEDKRGRKASRRKEEKNMQTAAQRIREKLSLGNRYYLEAADPALRLKTAEHGQHPYAIVVCCSDSRVIPEQIFHAAIGDLFVIR